MAKKIFAISTLLLVLVVGALFVYNFIFKKPTGTAGNNQPASAGNLSSEGKTGDSQALAPSANNPSQKTNPQNTSAIVAVSEEPILGATLSPDGSSLYYFLKESGQLNQVDFSGKLLKVLSTEAFSNLKRIVWNKPKNKAIITEEPSPGKTQLLLFDLVQEKVTPLDGNISAVSWSNQGDKIIYQFSDPKTKKKTLSIADPDGKNWQNITALDFPSVYIAPVPGDSLVSFWLPPSAFTGTSVNTLNISGGSKKEILRDRFGADILWSPSGLQAILSSTDQKGGHKIDLSTMNAQGGQIQSLMFPTFASKCAWSQINLQTLFCSLPGSLPESAVLPNDWQAGKFLTTDTFWKIDTLSGKKEHLLDPQKIGGAFDATNPFLSTDEKSLFFRNKSDGKLYKLSL